MTRSVSTVTRQTLSRLCCGQSRRSASISRYAASRLRTRCSDGSRTPAWCISTYCSMDHRRRAPWNRDAEPVLMEMAALFLELDFKREPEQLHGEPECREGEP